MNNEEVTKTIFFLIFFVAAIRLWYSFFKDFKFYAKNGWDFDQRRKGSTDVYNGETPLGLPLEGRNRFFGVVFLVIGISFAASVLFFGDVLPAIKKIL